MEDIALEKLNSLLANFYIKENVTEKSSSQER